MYVCVSVCICFTSFITPLPTPLDRGQVAGFKLGIHIDETDFTDWMSFLPSNIMEEISSQGRYLKPVINI